MRSFFATIVIAFFIPGILYAILPNPTLPLDGACGLDIALIIDSSGSIDDNELKQMKNAFHAFVDTFLPATPTQFSVIDFDDTGSVLLPFTANIPAIHAAINSPVSDGNTNWESALVHAQSTFEPRISAPNLVIIATDGDPNIIGATKDVYVSGSVAVEKAVVVADSIKSAGTRILVLGIGTEGRATFLKNLTAISGPNINTGFTSDVITTNFSTLATDLAVIARQQCGGTISVRKIIDRDANLNTTFDQLLVSDWEFDIGGIRHRTGEPGGDKGKTAPQTIKSKGPVDVVEVGGPRGYSFLAAHCTNINNGNSPIGTPASKAVTAIAVTPQDIISCTFYSKPGSLGNEQCPACPVGYEAIDQQCIFVGCPVTGC